MQLEVYPLRDNFQLASKKDRGQSSESDHQLGPAQKLSDELLSGSFLTTLDAKTEASLLDRYHSLKMQLTALHGCQCFLDKGVKNAIITLGKQECALSKMRTLKFKMDAPVVKAL